MEPLSVIKSIWALKKIGEMVSAASEAGDSPERDAKFVKAIGGLSVASLRAIPLKTEYAGLMDGLSGIKFNPTSIQSLLGLPSKSSFLYEGFSSVKKALEKTPIGRPATFVLKSLDELRGLEQDVMRWLDKKHGMLITAKKVEYVVGKPQYQAGTLTRVPLVGSLAQLSFKAQLKESITLADLVRAGCDVAAIVTLVYTADPSAAGAVSTASGTLAPATTASVTGAATVATKAGAATATVAGAQSLGAGQATAVIAGPSIAGVGQATGIQSVLASGRQVSSVVDSAGVHVKSDVAAQAVERWVRAEGLQIGSTINPGDLNARFRALDGMLSPYARNLYECNAGFRGLCNRFADRLVLARQLGPGEVLRVNTQIKRNVAGEFARQLGRDAIGCYFDRTVTEVPVPVGNTSTRIDVLFIGAKAPIIARGGLYIPKGGALAGELKAGQPGYLLGEGAGHLTFQAEGRRVADTAMTIVSRDISQLSMAMERRLRDAMRNLSPVFKFLQSKAELDSAVLDLVSNLAKSSGVST